jgi:hypothetical protein
LTLTGFEPPLSSPQAAAELSKYGDVQRILLKYHFIKKFLNIAELVNASVV